MIDMADSGALRSFVLFLIFESFLYGDFGDNPFSGPRFQLIIRLNSWLIAKRTCGRVGGYDWRLAHFQYLIKGTFRRMRDINHDS